MTRTTKKRTQRTKLAPPASLKRSGSKNKPLASKTKQQRVIEMLRSESGASVAALMEATGWQQHSVRGFLAGVVRKRLGLLLESTQIQGIRVYRIAMRSGSNTRAGDRHEL